MNKAFAAFLIAQFLSALSDNALLFAAIALLSALHAPDWHTPLLLQFFVIAYVLLAPFVGIVADAFPKGRVMLFSNTIKLIGCLAMVLGMPPLYAYSIVGIGAASYSPAKYGILSELLPEDKLVSANGWVEGTTVVAIILGAVLGGNLAAHNPRFAIEIIALIYLVAGIFNAFIPKLKIDHDFTDRRLRAVVGDFYSALASLWQDTLGRISLAVTTLFWGAGASLRLVVVAWAEAILHLSFEHATQLTAAVALGTALGAAIASRTIRLENALQVLPAGVLMGVLVASMAWVNEWHMAVILLFSIGALGGFFVVPLNALLQHRGHHLVGAGHSIAVQNFNENLSILLLSGIYAWMEKMTIPITNIVLYFGIFIILTMLSIQRHAKAANKITSPKKPSCTDG